MSGYGDHATISAIRYEVPKLSAKGTCFQAKGLWTPKIDSENIAYDSLFKDFSTKRFLYPRPPIDMGVAKKTGCGVLFCTDVATNAPQKRFFLPMVGKTSSLSPIQERPTKLIFQSSH